MRGSPALQNERHTSQYPKSLWQDEQRFIVYILPISTLHIIRILVQPDTNGARISIFDNLIAVSNALSAPARFLAWPLERRLADVTHELMQSVVEYFQGKWAEETREAVGTVRTIVLPTS